MNTNLAPIWNDELSEEMYEGIAELICKGSFEHEFGGNKYEQWIVKFIGSDKPVQRMVNSKYIQFVFKGDLNDEKRAD